MAVSWPYGEPSSVAGHPEAPNGGSGAGEIQLHTDAVGIVEEDLGIASARHDAFAEFHIPGLQPLAYTLNIRRGKGDMIEAAGVVELFLGAAHDDALAGLAGAHQVHSGSAARIKPIAGEVERRTIAVLQPQHVAIEVLGALQSMV